MKHRILTFAAVALCFTACSNDDEISQNFLADTPININVSVDEPRTRAGYSNDVLPDGFKLTVNHSNSPVDKYNYVVYAQRVEKVGRPSKWTMTEARLLMKSPCSGQTILILLTLWQQTTAGQKKTKAQTKN